LDRIDLHVEVPLVSFRERVVSARHLQQGRFKKSAQRTHAAMNARQVRQHCQLDATASGYLEQAMADMNFSARRHDRILKVARTPADLARAPYIRPNDILEAIQYRSLDRKLFS
jgi:magnesium chelatase family protein